MKIWGRVIPGLKVVLNRVRHIGMTVFWQARVVVRVFKVELLKGRMEELFTRGNDLKTRAHVIHLNIFLLGTFVDRHPKGAPLRPVP